MDVDAPEELLLPSTAPKSGRRSTTVPVDDAHPFDLEGYIANYSGAPIAVLMMADNSLARQGALLSTD